jgi:hypothetical protein
MPSPVAPAFEALAGPWRRQPARGRRSSWRRSADQLADTIPAFRTCTVVAAAALLRARHAQPQRRLEALTCSSSPRFAASAARSVVPSAELAGPHAAHRKSVAGRRQRFPARRSPTACRAPAQVLARAPRRIRAPAAEFPAPGGSVLSTNATVCVSLPRPAGRFQCFRLNMLASSRILPSSRGPSSSPSSQSRSAVRKFRSRLRTRIARVRPVQRRNRWPSGKRSGRRVRLHLESYPAWTADGSRS